jgi:hypothetical protein
MSATDRARRAEARRKSAVLHRTRLRRRELELDPVAGAAAVALVAQLTRESWAEAGLPLPTYTRAEVPIRFVPRRAP